jgi:hypothetical protein
MTHIVEKNIVSLVMLRWRERNIHHISFRIVDYKNLHAEVSDLSGFIRDILVKTIFDVNFD